MSRLERVGVVGAGTMGWGIASALTAVPGVAVVLLDIDAGALENARSRIAREHGKVAPESVEERMRALHTTVAYEDLETCDLVIEAAPESLDLKRRVLASIAKHVPDAIIATNTSSLSVAELSGSVRDPARFLGIHFFNPAARMPLVEVIRSPLTSAEVLSEIDEFLRERVGKETVVLDDRPGFLVNALLVPFLLAAARMADSGYAEPGAIDTAMKLGAGHPMGPLALSDLIGLDVLCAIADALYAQTRAPELVVPENMRRMVASGRLGRKSGRGFHRYD